MKKLAFIIVHYGSDDITLDCLRTLKNQNQQNFKVFLVDNSATGTIRDKIKDFKFLDLIDSGSNLGFAAGNNLGLRRALKEGYGNFVLLNNDTLLPADFTQKLLSISENLAAGIFSPKIYFAKGFEYHSRRYQENDKGRVFWYAGGLIDRQNFYAKNRGLDDVDLNQYEKNEETDFATGCCLVIKRDVLNKIGFLNEELFLYYEDVEYSLRAKKQLFKIFYTPEVFLWHKNARSGPGPGSDLHRYYQTRNRLSLGLKYAPLRTKKSLLLESVRQLLKGGITGKAVLDYYGGHMGRKNNL